MPDYVGYLASVLVLCTFCARTMIPLRLISLGSSVAFLTYGALLHLYSRAAAAHCPNAGQSLAIDRDPAPQRARAHRRRQRCSFRGVAAPRDAVYGELIPTPIDQNRCAQSRNPIDIMVQG